MYRKQQQEHQISVFDFNQSFGEPLEPGNEWVKLADEIDWKSLEARYAGKFTSHTGRPARPLRMMLGALIIQHRMALSDAVLIRTISEDPYLQYFLGLESFEPKAPFAASTLRRFKKRLDPRLLKEANAMLPQEMAIPEEVVSSACDPAEEDLPDIIRSEDAEAEGCGREDGARTPVRPRIGIVYTTHGEALTNEVERCVREEMGEDAEILSFGDATVLDEAAEAGRVTPPAASRLVRMYLDAVDAGCNVILNVCSSVGEVADAMQEFAHLIGVPIVRIDEEMCRRAVKDLSKNTFSASVMEGTDNDLTASEPSDPAVIRGGNVVIAAQDNLTASGPSDPAERLRETQDTEWVPRIAVMATLSSTLNPTKNLLRRCAEEAGVNIELKDVLVDNAFGLDPASLQAHLVEAALQSAMDCDVIVLAQGSMSLCEEAIREATGRKVYSSPRSGAYALRRAVEMLPSPSAAR